MAGKHDTAFAICLMIAAVMAWAWAFKIFLNIELGSM
jgi:hypothetical protein